MLEILSKLKIFEKRLARLEALEFSKVVPVKSAVSGVIRVLDDTTARAAAYANAAVQVTGATDTLGSGSVLPAKITGIWVRATLIPTAAGAVSAVIKNPNDTGNPTAVAGYSNAAGQLLTLTTFVTLNSSGQFYFQLTQAMNRTVWDVVAYVV